MTFSKPFGARGATGTPAVGAAFAASGLALVFNLVLAFGLFPAAERREREIPLRLEAVSEGTVPVRLSAQEVVVHVSAAGAVRVGGSELEIDAFEARLVRLAAEGGETALTVRADARAPYGLVARVIASGRKAGIRDASLVTVEPEAGAD